MTKWVLCLSKGIVCGTLLGTLTSWSQWQTRSLHPTGWIYTEASAVHKGQAAGGGIRSDGLFSAVLWGTLNASAATALNAQTSGSWAFDLFDGKAVGPAWSQTVHAGFWNPHYVDLNPPFTAWSNAFGIANSVTQPSQPAIAGIVLVGETWHAAVWGSPNPLDWYDLHPPNASQSFAYHINNNGAVVGVVDERATYWQRYDSPANMTNLHPSGAATSSYALCIDDAGWIGGFAKVAQAERAYLWNPTSGSAIDIHPSFAQESEVLGIYTVDGQTLPVGFVVVNGQQRAAAWLCLDATGVVDLHAFLPSGFNYSWARGVWRDSDGVWYVSGAAGINETQAEAYLWVLRPGDTNGDGCIDDSDLLAILLHYGESGCALPQDTNNDGQVDDADLLIVLLSYGNGCE